MNWNTQQLDWLKLYKDSSILGDDGNIVNVYIPKGLIDQYKNVYTDSIISNGVTVKWYDSIRKSNLGLIIGVGIAIFTLISESCFGGYIYYKHCKNKKKIEVNNSQK